jgi:hypothetical protein
VGGHRRALRYNDDELPKTCGSVEFVDEAFRARRDRPVFASKEAVPAVRPAIFEAYLMSRCTCTSR